MLQFADDDFIAGPDVLAAVALRDQVDAFRRAADKKFPFASAAPRNWRTFSRPASNNSVERAVSVCRCRNSTSRAFGAWLAWLAFAHGCTVGYCRPLLRSKKLDFENTP
jgi:hypothetical protein